MRSKPAGTLVSSPILVGAVTVLVSHRFSTVRIADLIVVVEGGRITETGSHAALLATGGTYAQLFALQAKAYLSGA